MAASTHVSHDTHSTTAGGSGWSTRRIAVTALFCALAFVTSFIEIPIFPPAPWLEYDPSCVVALVAGLAFGPATGVIVVALSWLLHLIFAFNPWGVLMAVLANVAFVAPCAAIARGLGDRLGKKRSLALGMLAGAAASLVVILLSNIVVTPMYTAVSTEAVIAMIIPILLPFNLIKLGLNCAIAALVQGPVGKVLGE